MFQDFSKTPFVGSPGGGTGVTRMLCGLVNVYAGNGQIISLQKNGNVSILMKGYVSDKFSGTVKSGNVAWLVRESRFSKKAFSKNEIRSRLHFVRTLLFSALAEFQREKENWPKNNSAISRFANHFLNIVISPVHTFTLVNCIIYNN